MVIEIYENVDIARVTLNGRGMYAARITSQIRILLACIRAAAAAARNRKYFSSSSDGNREPENMHAIARLQACVHTLHTTSNMKIGIAEKE